MSSDDDRGPSVRAVTTTTLVVATIFVLARLVTRIGIVKHVALDDYFIIAATLLVIGLSASIDYGCSKGLGLHEEKITQWDELRRAEYAFSVLYNPALMATKSSILIFYLRLSRNTVKLLRIASYVTLLLVNIVGIVLTLLNAFQCSPVNAVFDGPNVPGEPHSSTNCIPSVTLYLASAPVNIITGLAILVLPIPVLTGIRLPPKQKTILVVTFSLGIFVVVIDVIRIYYLQQASDWIIVVTEQASNTTQPASGAFPQASNGIQQAINGTRQAINGTINGYTEFPYYASLALMWSAVEVNIGIICACIPTLKPLITKILPKLIHDNTDRASDRSPSFVSPVDFSSEKDAHQQWPSPPQSATLPPRRESGGSKREQGLGGVEFLTKPDFLKQPDFLTVPGFLTTPGMDHGNTEQEMGMMDFLTTPDMDPSHLKRTQTHQSHTTENTVYFGFVNMRRPRSMLKTRGMESLKYCTMVTILFFLWGFSYGLLNGLNEQITKIAYYSTQQALGLQSAYFGAYLLGPLSVGQWVLKKGGFKACFITGLCIYGTGALMFWPSAVLFSFSGFFVSNFVVGFGLSVLETAANPFLALCGHSDYAEMRLLTAQGVQAVGSVISSVLAQAVLYNGLNVIDVQWTYLAVALLSVVLALFFYYMPLPEVSDEELYLESQPKIPQHNNMIARPSQTRIGKCRIIYITLIVGITTQFLYVGVQESFSVNLETLLINLDQTLSSLSSTPFHFSLIGRGTFAIGRFLAAFLCLLFRPRIILLLAFLGALVFSILVFAVTASSSSLANTVAGMSIMVLFFEGPIWPIIFAISLRQMGRATKSAAAFLTAAASGGTVFPWIMFALQAGATPQHSFSVPIALFAVGLIFPLYLNVVPAARGQVDPLRDRGSISHIGDGESNGDQIVRPQAHFHRFGRACTVVMAKLKDSHKREGGADAEFPTVEHRERKSWGSKD